jgi:hypothetical protein
MPAREGDGKVRCEHCLPAEWGRGGAGVEVLDVGWGLEAVEGEKKGKERIYPRSPRVSLLLCVQVQKDKD